MISLQNISKSFQDGKNRRMVLQNVHLNVNPGTLTAIMGRSGCGKTTLLYILAGLMQPDQGIYHFQGKELPLSNRKAMQQFRLQNIGFVLQEDTLLYDRNVQSNILLGTQFIKHDRHHIQSEMKELAAQLDISDLLQAPPAILSGGEKQRVAIARALLGNKSVLLADEPTGALDRENALRVMECLAKVREQGRTILLVTHDETIAQMCDRTVRLVYGQITEETECNQSKSSKESR